MWISWTEVRLLLRKAIQTEEDMLYTAAAAEAGIFFTDQVRGSILFLSLTHTIVALDASVHSSLN